MVLSTSAPPLLPHTALRSLLIFFANSPRRLCFFPFFSSIVSHTSIHLHQNVFRADVSLIHPAMLSFSLYPSSPPLVSLPRGPPGGFLSSPSSTPHCHGPANQLIQLHCHQARRCPGMTDLGLQRLFSMHWRYHRDQVSTDQNSVDSLAPSSLASRTVGSYSSHLDSIHTDTDGLQLQARCSEARLPRQGAP